MARNWRGPRARMALTGDRELFDGAKAIFNLLRRTYVPDDATAARIARAMGVSRAELLARVPELGAAAGSERQAPSRARQQAGHPSSQWFGHLPWIAMPDGLQRDLARTVAEERRRREGRLVPFWDR